MANMTDLFLSHPGLPGQVRRYLVEGLWPAAPTTPSAQGAGVAGVCAVRISEDNGLIRLPAEDGAESGHVLQRAATDDVVLVNEASYLQVGQERRLDRVATLDLSDDSLSLQVVSGAAAADGAGAYPTNAEIEAAVGFGRRPWARLYGVRIRRTADIVLAITYDFTRRPLGVYRAGAAKHTSLR